MHLTLWVKCIFIKCELGVQPALWAFSPVRSAKPPSAVCQPALHPVLRQEFNSHDLELLPGEVAITEFLLCNLK